MNVKKIREQLELDKQELAFKLGVSINTIYRWERNENKPHKTFQRKLNRLLRRQSHETY